VYPSACLGAIYSKNKPCHIKCWITLEVKQDIK
jgi:hypothetical protein